MDDYLAQKQALREHPVYVRACKTEPVMHDWPPKWVAKSRWREIDDWKLIHAGRRLDWLFRRALACENPWGVLDPQAVCAIEDCILFIADEMAKMTNVSVSARREIMSRIEFGHSLLEIDFHERAENGWPRNHNLHQFENFVIQHGFTLEEMVFQNPFQGLYHSPGGYSGVSSTNHAFNYFHILMKHFWE